MIAYYWNSKNQNLLIFNSMNLNNLNQDAKLNSLYIFILWGFWGCRKKFKLTILSHKFTVFNVLWVSSGKPSLSNRVIKGSDLKLSVQIKWAEYVVREISGDRVALILLSKSGWSVVAIVINDNYKTLTSNRTPWKHWSCFKKKLYMNIVFPFCYISYAYYFQFSFYI